MGYMSINQSFEKDQAMVPGGMKKDETDRSSNEEIQNDLINVPTGSNHICGSQLNPYISNVSVVRVRFQGYVHYLHFHSNLGINST